MSEFKKIAENLEEFPRIMKYMGLGWKTIADHEEANRKCIHSIIQYLLIKSGEKV
ncbi:MAG: hypothetical protein QW385_07655 [Thermoproteota archaeon]